MHLYISKAYSALFSGDKYTIFSCISASYYNIFQLLCCSLAGQQKRPVQNQPKLILTVEKDDFPIDWGSLHNSFSLFWAGKGCNEG